MKKILSTALLLLLCSTLLCSCGTNEKSPAEIAGVRLDAGIYRYYLDLVNASPADYGIVAVDNSTVIEVARKLCKTHVAIETEYEAIKAAGVTMTPDEKGEISEEVNSLWNLLESRYEEIDVEKHILTAVKTNEMKRRLLLHYYFDTEGEYPTQETAIKAYFDANYVAFKSVNGYLTDTDDQGNTYLLSGDALSAVVTRFERMLSDVKNGVAIEEVDKDSGSGVTTTFISKGNASYPHGFFDCVVSMDYDTPEIFRSDEYIFLIERVDADEGENSYYDSLRSECLEALKGNLLVTFLDTKSADYTVEIDEKVAAKCEDRVF